MNDNELILLCAVRYAMGRRSYIVSDAQRWAVERWETLGPQARTVLLRDLKEALEREKEYPGSLGMTMDVVGWQKLYDWILEQQTGQATQAA